MQRWRCCVTLPFRAPDVSCAVHSIISAPADVDADCCRPALMVSVNDAMLTEVLRMIHVFLNMLPTHYGIRM
jgi:hypothetical protein